MIKQVYDNRVDEILDCLKNRIIKEPFEENLDLLVNNYVKISNVQIRTIETSQKQNTEILKKLEEDLNYYKNQEANQSEAHKEFKVIVKYLENFLGE